ncbi:EAL domain-containing protein [Massilia sp. R2A-15]|uniref:putative bifunctional diguanylate cyclase/phosphodiesterase n=1 Tax=Massilia sp. R2A-15 TaxID=3064278 RepID=UPI0027344361|nr:bifunctional diguanylate cyclase/phosphodiesterase [Massilia sp. R2A-15]WLI87485.1 EAL domain-containing protein [Massilia sp. R2A-15]
MPDAALDRCLRLARAARSLQGAALDAVLCELDEALAAAGARADGDDEEPALSLDLAGYVTGWNRGAHALFGYTPDEALGQHVLFLDADDGDEPAGWFAEPGSAPVEVLRRTKSGEIVRVAMALSMIHDDAGEPAGVMVRLAPAAGALTGQDKLALHSRMIEDSDYGVLITDAGQRIVSVNAAFSRLTGYSAAEALGQGADMLSAGVHDADLVAKVRAAMQGHGPWRGEIVGRHKSGEPFPQTVTISVVRDAAGAVTHAFSLFSDIGVHKDAEARMQRLANYDTLTGLPNRSLFNHLVDQMLSEARRASEYGALLVIEVDRVAAYGESLGADVAGDAVREVGRRFRGALRDADILARIDTVKFAVALPHIEKREHAGIVAQKLLATLAQPVAAGAHSLRVGARIGVAVYLEDSTDTATLIRYADVAVARVEAGADDRFLFYSEEMDQRAKDHLRLENELRAALAGGQLELHYQPKVSLRSGRMVGAEALIRWRHPERGMVPPAEFIPLAEETGLIFDIGAWVLDEACRQVRAWKDAGLAMPPVAINLSARQFDRRLPARIQQVLDRHGVLPEQIMLEITESLLVGGSDSVIAIMNELVAMGLALALDDFGTGYSSLAYLKKFPISTLKIDRSFVVGLPDGENDCAIARAIVTMAQQLRQEIVAEGVETAEQMAFLRDLGCDQLQGWLFSAAVTGDEFARMQQQGARLQVGR